MTDFLTVAVAALLGCLIGTVIGNTIADSLGLRPGRGAGNAPPVGPSRLSTSLPGPQRYSGESAATVVEFPSRNPMVETEVSDPD